jgi:hypothetical protein
LRISRKKGAKNHEKPQKKRKKTKIPPPHKPKISPKKVKKSKKFQLFPYDNQYFKKNFKKSEKKFAFSKKRLYLCAVFNNINFK